MPNSVDINSNLIAAVQKGNTDYVMELLDRGTDVNAKDEDGRTALMNAAREGHTGIVLTLLDKGADVNVKERIYGATALMWASWYGHITTLQTLLDKGADVNVKSAYDKTALTGAEKEGYTEIIELLKSAGATE